MSMNDLNTQTMKDEVHTNPDLEEYNGFKLGQMVLLQHCNGSLTATIKRMNYNGAELKVHGWVGTTFERWLKINKIGG